MAWRAGKYLVARIAPETTPSAELTFLVDTSASEPAPLERISERLLEIGAALAKQQPNLLISVLGFDQEIHPILVRSRLPLTAAQLAPLRELRRLGGTDLAYAGLALLEQALPHEHLVMLSDLENTMAPASIAALASDGRSRYDLLTVDAASETKLREKLKQSGRLEDFPGVIVRLDTDATQIAERLLAPTPSKLTLHVDGATWLSPPQEEYAQQIEVTPRVGEAVWLFAELAANKPLELSVSGKALPNLQTSSDPAVVALLAQLVGQARLDQLLAGDGRAFLDEESAPAVPDQLTRIAKAYGLLPAQSSILVRAGASALAGRVVEPLAAPREIMTVQGPPDTSTKVANEKCPDLIGLGKERTAERGCPPLYVSFSSPEARLIADIQFAQGANQPNVAASPHLSQLADLLALRPELAQLVVKASSTARADGVIRYLVSRGISPERLHAAPLDARAAPGRRPTPSCKSPGETVVLEVRTMSAAPLSPAIVKKPLSTFNAGPSRLAHIDQLLRSAELKSDKLGLARARAVSEQWLAEAPASPLPYVALGNSLAALRDARGAARAYGSLFDLTAPGAGLAAAAAARLQQLAPDRLAMGRYNDGNGALEQRWRELAAATWSARERDPHEGLEASRAGAYASLRAKRSREAFYGMLEAAARSPLSARLELPVFAHVYAAEMRDAPSWLETYLARDCAFPLQASVRGAFLSWEDVDSELEVSVTSVRGGYSYDSTLAEHGAGGGLKWIPLPEDDASYPIRVTVRAERLSKNGYAFGVLRTLDSPGSGRARSEERPFVATQVGEPLTVLEEQILQRPQ